MEEEKLGGKDDGEKREAYLTETIELNHIESFCFFLKISKNIKRLSLLDSLVMKRKRAVAYVSSDYSEHNQYFRAQLKEASSIEILEKIKFEKGRLYKGFRHRHLSNRIATVWFIDSLITMSAATVSEAELTALLRERPADVVCIQPLLGGVPLNATGIFEHRYKIGPTGRKSFETFELMNDIRGNEGKINYDDLNFYNTGVDKLQVSGHRINALLEKEMQRVLDYLEFALNIRVSNLTLQAVFDSTLRPYITAAKDVIIIAYPSEYYYHREHIYYIDGEAPSLPVSNDTVSELLLSMGRVLGVPKSNVKKHWTLPSDLVAGVGSADSRVEDEQEQTFRDALNGTMMHTASSPLAKSTSPPLPSHSPEKKRNIQTRLSPFRALSPTRDVCLGKASTNLLGQKLDLKMNVSKSCSHFELNTLSQYVKQSSYFASMAPLEVPWGAERTAHLMPRPHTADKRQGGNGEMQEVKLPGIYKSMLMPTKGHNCRGDYCHFSKMTSADESRGTKDKLFVAPIKSVLMAKAEEHFLEDSALSRANFGNATIYNDQNLSYFARLQLERVEQKVLDKLKKIGLTSIPRFNYSLLDYYDYFSRRTIYSDLLSSVHVSRLYHTVPVCATCHKMYGYFDGLRNQIVFHGRVHRERAHRPLSHHLGAAKQRPASASAGGTVLASPGEKRSTVRELLDRRARSAPSPEEEEEGEGGGGEEDDDEEEEQEEGDFFPSPNLREVLNYSNAFSEEEEQEEEGRAREDEGVRGAIAARHRKAKERSKAQPLAQQGAHGKKAEVRQRASKTLSTWLNLFREKAAAQEQRRGHDIEMKQQEEEEEEEEEERREQRRRPSSRAEISRRRSSNQKSLDTFTDQRRKAAAAKGDKEKTASSLLASSTKIENRISDFRRIYSDNTRQMDQGGLGARRGSVMPAR